jgi:hypothetical protein
MNSKRIQIRKAMQDEKEKFNNDIRNMKKIKLKF